MSALAMLTLSDLPYHSDKIPSTTADAVDAISKILKFEPFHTTKKDEYTLQTLCGVMLYRHLAQPRRNKVMEMIVNKDHIAPVDWWELRAKCTDVLVQPLWGLWSLTTPELESILKDQKNLQAIFNAIGLSPSIAAVVDLHNEWKRAKRYPEGSKERKYGMRSVFLRVPVVLIVTSWAYVNAKQLSNTQEELDRRTSNPKSSPFHK